MASKAIKLGNRMIWMVHRAHLDDPTLVKFDPWQKETKEVVYNLNLRKFSFAVLPDFLDAIFLFCLELPGWPHCRGLHQFEDARWKCGASDLPQIGSSNGEPLAVERASCFFYFCYIFSLKVWWVSRCLYLLFVGPLTCFKVWFGLKKALTCWICSFPLTGFRQYTYWELATRPNEILILNARNRKTAILHQTGFEISEFLAPPLWGEITIVSQKMSHAFYICTEAHGLHQSPGSRSCHSGRVIAFQPITKGGWGGFQDWSTDVRTNYISI